MFRSFLLFFIVIHFLVSSSAATLKGKVTDEKGNVLPYSTIFIEGTTVGTSANGNGDFELPMANGLYKVVCQCIGYKQSSFNIEVIDNSVIQHNFILTEQSFEMKEVVIHASAEDPAYDIIRHVIKRRQFHLDQVKSFQTSIYLKAVARSRNLPDKFMGQKIKTADLDVDSAGKGVLYLSEQTADYYRQGDKEQTLIHSVRVSGNSNGLGFARLPPVVTFYENNIRFFSARGSISPIGENALFYYKYKLQGEFTEAGRKIYKIGVTQRRNYEPCFNGTIYVVDSDWALHSVDLVLLKESGIDLFDTIKMQQFFLPAHPDEWVIKSQLFYLTAKFFAFDITANASAVYDNQKINAPIPDSVFNKKIVSIYDHAATQKDTAYWKTTRPVPLEKDEMKNFKIQDSINKIVDNPKSLDSVRKKENRQIKPLEFLLSGKTFNGYKNKNTFSVSSLVTSLNFNTVDGVNVAPKFGWKHILDTGSELHFLTAVRYGFSNQHLNIISRLYVTKEDKSWKTRYWMYGIVGGKYVFQYNGENPVVPFINTITSLGWRENDLKLYERWEGSAFAKRNYGNGFTWFVRASYQVRLPLQNTSNFSFDKSNSDSYTSNFPARLSQLSYVSKNEAMLLHISLSWKPGFKYIQYPAYKSPSGSKYPLFGFEYDKGIPSIGGSKSDFDKYKFTISNSRSLRLLGTFSYRVGVGGFLNTNYIAAPDFNYLFGNRGIGIASPYLRSFQLAPFYDFSNTESLYGDAHLEYKMKGLLSNKIPLFRQAKLYFIVGGNAFYASQRNYYTEAFVGIDNLGWKSMRFLRIDFIQSWDSNFGHIFGVRLGINGGGVSFSISGNDETQSEW